MDSVSDCTGDLSGSIEDGIAKSNMVVVDPIKQLKQSVEMQYIEMQDLLASNAIMAEVLAKTNGVPVETLKQDLQRSSQQLELIKSEKAEFESKVSMYQNLNEQSESALNMVIKVVKTFGDEEDPSSAPDSSAQVREEAEKESESEVNRLLVCLGQEQSKVEKLSGRLMELSEDVDKLLQGIGDDAGIREGSEGNEDNAGLPREDETNEVDVGIPGESEEVVEVVGGLPEESEEVVEVFGGLPEESEDVEDVAGLPEESKEGENSISNEDSSVELLLDRISNVELAEDRSNAFYELVNLLAYSSDAELAFLANGFPVMMSVLKEERDDADAVQSALEVINNGVTINDLSKLKNKEFQPALTSVDLLSRDADSISILLSFLEEDGFMLKYLTLHSLTGIVKNFPNRLHETILAIPDAIPRLMDMLMDNQNQTYALEFLTHLTHQSKEIQETLVSEGVFEKILSIIEDQGGLNGDRVLEECLKLLNSLLYKNAANQKLVRDTMGFDTLLLVLKLQGVADSFTKQKTCNVLCGLETINLLIMEDSEADPEEDGILINKTTLVQAKILDHLLMLGVESHEAPVVVHCSALRCIGDLICGHSENRDALASKFFGEERQEPALNLILRFILRTSSTQEFVAADYVFKNFCEKNPEGQAMLASTLVPQPYSDEEDVNLSFGSVLLRGFENLETSCRAASVLCHVLKDNNQLKETVLGIELLASIADGAVEALMQRIVKHLALVSFMGIKEGESNKSVNSYFRPIVLKLLVVWLAGRADAVNCFLDSHPGLTYLLELLSNESESAFTKGLAAVILGECVVYKKSLEGTKDGFMVVRIISQKIGLLPYFLKFDEMRKTDPFASANSDKLSKPVSGIEDFDKNDEDNLVLSAIFDTHFVTLVKNLEADIREKLEELSSQPKSSDPVVLAELEQKDGETEEDYITRLKEFAKKQCTEIQDLRSSNAAMARELAKTDGVPIETLLQDLHMKSHQFKLVNLEKVKLWAEAAMAREISDELESVLNDVNSTFDGLKFQIARSELPNVEAIKAKAREKSLSALLCQEQSKVEKLSIRLLELGQEVGELLKGIDNEASF